MAHICEKFTLSSACHFGLHEHFLGKQGCLLEVLGYFFSLVFCLLQGKLGILGAGYIAPYADYITGLSRRRVNQ